MEDCQRDLARLYRVYADGITDVSWVAETMAQEYGIPFQVPRCTKDRKDVMAAIQQANLLDISREAIPERFFSILERKYAVLLQADTLFAFGYLTQDCKMLRGGTGWCVKIAMDMGKTIYVYDIESGMWFHFKNNQFCLKQETPTLALKSMILGSKEIGPVTNNAIQALFHSTFSTHLQELTRCFQEFNL